MAFFSVSDIEYWELWSSSQGFWDRILNYDLPLNESEIEYWDLLSSHESEIEYWESFFFSMRFKDIKGWKERYLLGQKSDLP